ncbi:hypothetical protein ACP4OV_025736 [Aristida adscensionis]
MPASVPRLDDDDLACLLVAVNAVVPCRVGQRRHEVKHSLRRQKNILR